MLRRSSVSSKSVAHRKVKLCSRKMSEHLCGHGGPRAVRRAERGRPLGPPQHPQTPGRLSGIVFSSVWGSACLYSLVGRHYFPQGFKGVEERFIFLCLANSLSPPSLPRHQESQKLKPGGLWFLSEEGPQQQMRVEQGNPARSWGGGTRPWVFSAEGAGREGGNSPR